MADMKLEEECCVENKQLVTASSSSLSEGSGSVTVKSPGISSPATTSPSHRYCLLFYFSPLLFVSSWSNGAVSYEW